MGLIKRLKIIYFEIFIFVSGLAIRLLYLSQTPYNLRDHDAFGHLEFIQYIVNNGRLPIYNQGWEFYQQPLYYAIGALTYRISQLLQLDFHFILQILSLTFFMGTLVCFYFIIKLFIRTPLLRLLTFCLVVFWPSGIIHSVRVGNDTLQYLTFTASFLFLLKWVKTRNINMMYASSILFIISMLTKSNAVILLPLFFVTYYQKLSSMKLKLKQIFKHLLLPFIVVIISLFILTYNNFFHQQQNYFVANVTNLNGNLRVENNPVNFLYFDWATFIKRNYINPWDDTTGRQYFWNYLLKTSLFGEFGFSGKIQLILSQVLSFTIVMVITYTIIGAFSQRKKQLMKFVYIYLFLISQLVFMIVGRIFLPFASTNDFRFIFPSIVSFAILFASAISFFKVKKLIFFEYVGYLFLFLFIFSSIIFFLFPL